MKSVEITQRLQELADKPNIVDFRGGRIMPEAISLIFRSETRRGLFWYNPQTKVMAFSTEAKTHFQLENFPTVKDFREWKRGGVFEKEGICYMLIQTGDFSDVIHGQTLCDVYHLAESMSQRTFSGVIDESGCDLLTRKG